MARKDWYYINIKQDMALCLDYIIKKDGAKYGIEDRVQLIRWLLGEFIARWEKERNMSLAKDGLSLREKERTGGTKKHDHNQNHNNPMRQFLDGE